MRALLKKTFRLGIDRLDTGHIIWTFKPYAVKNMAITTRRSSRKKKVHTNTIFFIFVLSEDTGRLPGLRGSDNESEEE